jgi:hypothetical protein
MAHGNNSGLAIQIGLSVLPSLIQATEDYMGAGNGADKHDAVLAGLGAVVSSIAQGGVVIAAQNNPNYAQLAQPLASFFSQIISAIVSGRKQAGVPVTPANPPATSGATQ